MYLQAKNIACNNLSNQQLKGKPLYYAKAFFVHLFVIIVFLYPIIGINSIYESFAKPSKC